MIRTKNGFDVLEQEDVEITEIKGGSTEVNVDIGDDIKSALLEVTCESIISSIRESAGYNTYLLKWTKGGLRSPIGVRVGGYIILGTQHGMVSAHPESKVEGRSLEDIFNSSCSWHGDYTRIKDEPGDHIMIVRMYKDGKGF